MKSESAVILIEAKENAAALSLLTICSMAVNYCC